MWCEMWPEDVFRAGCDRVVYGSESAVVDDEVQP
ncbi:MAG: hypothetical protein JWM57_221 [Phycisphaerales bacterium]|nr:hypothetical protein [Phycisphaerales bacterium]